MQPNTLSLIIPAALIPILLLALWRIGLWKLKSYHSPLLGKIEVFRKYNGEKVLTINSYAQGVSVEQKSITQSYWFFIAKKIFDFCQGKKDPQILMLGLGANTIPNLIVRLNPQIHQTLVEIDKCIIEACKKYFRLNELPSYTLITADAYKLLDSKKAFPQKFDAIIVDIFTGKPPYVSLESNQPNFIEKLLPWIKRDGMIIFNRPGNTEGACSDSQKLKEYLATLFKKTNLTNINDSRGYRNNIILGYLPKRQNYR